MKIKSENSFIAVLILALLLPSCGKNVQYPPAPLNTAEQFKEQYKEEDRNLAASMFKPGKALAPEDRGQWWKIFGDEELNKLEDEAAEANHSLKAAASKVVQAHEAARAAVPDILPNIGIGANGLRTTSGFIGEPRKPYNFFTTSLNASYNLSWYDFKNYKAMKLSAEAEKAAYQDMVLLLQAEVASNYFSIRAIDAEHKLLINKVETEREAMRITEKKYELEEINATELATAQVQLAAAENELMDLTRKRAALEHAIAILVGKVPALFSLAQKELDTEPPLIPAGLPSTLLERRADIIQAEKQMAAANQKVGAAKAAFFPSISLTAGTGVASSSLSNLFNSSQHYWSLGQFVGNLITIPIFSNGREFANLRHSKAAYEESVENYRTQVLIAFREGEDSLVDQKMLAREALYQDKAKLASAKAIDATKKRYELGDADHSEVVSVNQMYIEAKRRAVQINNQRLLTTVALIRALGGGWEQALANEDSSQNKVKESKRYNNSPNTKLSQNSEAYSKVRFKLVQPLN